MEGRVWCNREISIIYKAGHNGKYTCHVHQFLVFSMSSPPRVSVCLLGVSVCLGMALHYDSRSNHKTLCLLYTPESHPTINPELYKLCTSFYGRLSVSVVHLQQPHSEKIWLWLFPWHPVFCLCFRFLASELGELCFVCLAWFSACLHLSVQLILTACSLMEIHCLETHLAFYCSCGQSEALWNTERFKAIVLEIASRLWNNLTPMSTVTPCSHFWFWHILPVVSVKRRLTSVYEFLTS